VLQTAYEYAPHTLPGLLSPLFLTSFLQNIDHQHFLNQSPLNKKAAKLHPTLSAVLALLIKRLSNFSSSCERVWARHDPNTPICKTCSGCAYRNGTRETTGKANKKKSRKITQVIHQDCCILCSTKLREEML